MKTCKIKPEVNTCLSCVDVQVAYNQIENCNQCELTKRQYTLVSVGVGGIFATPYAIVQYNGKLEKVALDRVYNIREVE